MLEAVKTAKTHWSTSAGDCASARKSKKNTSNKTKLKSKQPFSKRCASAVIKTVQARKKATFPKKEKRKGEKGA